MYVHIKGAYKYKYTLGKQERCIETPGKFIFIFKHFFPLVIIETQIPQVVGKSKKKIFGKIVKESGNSNEG